MSENQKLFARRLEALRVARKMTVREVARAIEVPESTYRDWENGRGLRIPPVEKLSVLFAISVTELVTGEESKHEDLLNDLREIENQIVRLRIKIASRF